MLPFNYRKISLPRILQFFGGLERSTNVAFQLNRKPQARSQPPATRGLSGQESGTGWCTAHREAVAQPFLSRPHWGHGLHSRAREGGGGDGGLHASLS